MTTHRLRTRIEVLERTTAKAPSVKGWVRRLAAVTREKLGIHTEAGMQVHELMVHSALANLSIAQQETLENASWSRQGRFLPTEAESEALRVLERALEMVYRL